MERSPIPIACSLDSGDIPARLAEWRALAGRAQGHEPIAGGTRLRFAPEPTLAATAADLAAREQGCCGFFTFTLTITAGDLMLDVTAPDDASPLVGELLGV